MFLLPTNPFLVRMIQVASCIAIASALVLVSAKLIGRISAGSVVDTLFWIASVALVAHVIEGIIAAVLASKLGESPLKAGFFVFWTGIGGLSPLIHRSVISQANSGSAV